MLLRSKFMIEGKIFVKLIKFMLKQLKILADKCKFHQKLSKKKSILKT